MTTTLQQRLWAIDADKGQIEQILLNLSVNARDAMPGGGRLSISTRNVDLSQEQSVPHDGAMPGPYVMLTVTDTGVGMNEETQYKVFEPFFTTKQPGVGTGLGLATVYGIVKQAGGHIWLYSEPEQGTTFKIFFPRSTAREPAAQTVTEPVSLEGTESILLVEDDASIRGLASRILTSHGYGVISAGSGEEALEMLGSGEVETDLVITDIVLPGMNGRDTAMRLRDVAPKVKTLFMSGYTDDEIVRRGLVHDNAVFLSKPFSADGLLRKAREALDFLP
jgi:CheY-like chemotaxis protein